MYLVGLHIYYIFSCLCKIFQIQGILLKLTNSTDIQNTIVRNLSPFMQCWGLLTCKHPGHWNLSWASCIQFPSSHPHTPFNTNFAFIIPSIPTLSDFYHPKYSILGFRREVTDNCVLLGCCTASGGGFLQTIGDNRTVLSSRVNNLKVVPVGCPETSVRNHHHSLRSNPEDAVPLYAYVSEMFYSFKVSRLKFCEQF